MSFHSLALRPEPGLAATLEKARAMGLAITGHALSEIRTAAWECPDPAGIDGLLIGSANAILHGGPHLARLTGKPVYAVGEATAAAARAAGFDVAMTGSGGLQGVLDAIHAPCHLLRIAGEEHVPLTPPEGVTFAEVIAYRSVMLRIDPVAALLRHRSTSSTTTTVSGAAPCAATRFCTCRSTTWRSSSHSTPFPASPMALAMLSTSFCAQLHRSGAGSRFR
jgi:uroporphyrinogen-III synthase